MTTDGILMIIEKHHLRVKLHPRLLEVDLTDGLRGYLEDLAESRQAVRETLGFLFQTIIPLDVPLGEIQSTGLDEKGRVKIVISTDGTSTYHSPRKNREPYSQSSTRQCQLKGREFWPRKRSKRRESESRQPGRKHFEEDSLKSADIE